MQDLICAIHQPSYIPWTPFFHKMASSDVWIHLDDVAFMKNGLQNRHKIKSAQGSMWLTVPVHAQLGQPLLSVEVADDAALRRHWQSIQMCYSKAPYWSEYQDALLPIYSRQWVRLAELNTALTDAIANLLAIRPRVYLASDLGITTTGSQRILDLCTAVGATKYLSGIGGIDYLDVSHFTQSGLEVLVQMPRTPPYQQRYDQVGFLPGLSVLDALFNLGPKVREYVAQCGEILTTDEARAVSGAPADAEDGSYEATQ